MSDLEEPVASSQLDKRPRARPVAPVSPADEPSAKWGWHGRFPNAARIGGGFLVVALLLMLIGNHRNKTEDIWLVAIAALILVIMVVNETRRRTSWRR